MRTAVKPDLKSQTFATAKSLNLLREKEISIIDLKFYQKLFVVSPSLIGITPSYPIYLVINAPTKIKINDM